MYSVMNYNFYYSECQFCDNLTSSCKDCNINSTWCTKCLNGLYLETYGNMSGGGICVT